MSRIRRTDAKWAELIRECKASGLSDMEWLKQNHISPSSLYNKLQKLVGETEQNTPLPEKRCKRFISNRLDRWTHMKRKYLVMKNKPCKCNFPVNSSILKKQQHKATLRSDLNAVCRITR